VGVDFPAFGVTRAGTAAAVSVFETENTAPEPFDCVDPTVR